MENSALDLEYSAAGRPRLKEVLSLVRSVKGGVRTALDLLKDDFEGERVFGGN